MTRTASHLAALLVDDALEARSTPARCVELADAEVARLTARLRAGEEAAWHEFHRDYFARLLGYLLVVCRGDEDAAREAVQAALVKIARHVRRFDRAEAWWGWLTVVARSCVIDGARRRSRYRALLERYASFFTPLPAPPADEPLPELLEECLVALPAADRTLLIAKYRDGQTTAALATESGCTGKAMESRLARLRQHVKATILRRLSHED
jgi:RNA polymerase sigma-70 factor (ECF subfamily)